MLFLMTPLGQGEVITMIKFLSWITTTIFLYWRKILRTLLTWSFVPRVRQLVIIILITITKVADHRQSIMIRIVSSLFLSFGHLIIFCHLRGRISDPAVIRSYFVDEISYSLIVIDYVGMSLPSFEAVYIDIIFWRVLIHKKCFNLFK